MLGTKQGKLGEINNSVMDEFKTKGILVESDPGKFSNDGIPHHLAFHLNSVLIAKHFGDSGSKAVEAETLSDLTSIINNRRGEANLPAVSKEQITEAVVTGWNKVVAKQQEQQAQPASQQVADWKDRITLAQTVNVVGATR